MDVAELREHAAECVMMAQNCSTDGERLAFLELAQTWLELAQQQERAIASLAAVGRQDTDDRERKVGLAQS